MKIAILGYGAMGRTIERLAIEKGHEIGAVIDEESSQSKSEDVAERLTGAEVAIEFSVREAVVRNAEACAMAGVPLVEGTTGWLDDLEVVRRLVEERDSGFVYGANFSVGVNLFYRIVGYAAELCSRFEEYEVFIEEQHHSRKLDAPSGTALKLKGIVEKHTGADFSVSSTRAGNIPGTHRVGFDGTADQILLEHFARSREGFASGAIAAAEWVKGKKGFWEFTEVIDQILLDR